VATGLRGKTTSAYVGKTVKSSTINYINIFFGYVSVDIINEIRKKLKTHLIFWLLTSSVGEFSPFLIAMGVAAEEMRLTFFFLALRSQLF